MIPPFPAMSGGLRLRLGKRGGGAAAPFTPASLSGLIHWLDPSRGVTASANRISAIANQAGGTLNWAQGTAANQPLLEASSGPNSTPSIYFLQSRSDRLFMSAGLPTAAPSGGECFLIVKTDLDPPATNQGVMQFGSLVNGTYYADTLAKIYDSWGSSTRQGPFVHTGKDLSLWHTVNVWSQTNDWSYQIDGTTLATLGTNATGFPAGPVLGQGATYFTGRVACMLIYSRKLSAPERAQVAAWILSTYGI